MPPLMSVSGDLLAFKFQIRPKEIEFLFSLSLKRLIPKCHAFESHIPPHHIEKLRKIVNLDWIIADDHKLFRPIVSRLPCLR
jgi:hypothetical protein